MQNAYTQSYLDALTDADYNYFFQNRPKITTMADRRKTVAQIINGRRAIDGVPIWELLEYTLLDKIRQTDLVDFYDVDNTIWKPTVSIARKRAAALFLDNFHKTAKCDRDVNNYRRIVLDNRDTILTLDDVKILGCFIHHIMTEYFDPKVTNRVIDYNRIKDRFNTIYQDNVYSGDVTPFVLKYNKGADFLQPMTIELLENNLAFQERFNQDVVPEEFYIGMTLINRLRQVIPNFACTLYGLHYPCIVYDNKKFQEDKEYAASFKGGCDYIFTEKIEGKTLSEHAKDHTVRDYIYLIFQVALSLELAMDMIDFTHYDLHPNNIIIKTLRAPMSIKYKNYTIESIDIPTVIDYGYSHGRAQNSKGDVINLGIASGFLGISGSSSFWIYDMFKLLAYFSYRAKLFPEANAVLMRFFVEEEELKDGLEDFLKKYKGNYEFFETYKTDFNKDASIKSFIEYMIAKFPFLFDLIKGVTP